MERVDRLLLVAHYKDRAGNIARADPGGEFLRQQPDHLPLIGRGVLGLVHQNVVDATVQPEQHPLRHRRIGQQGLGAGNQIVEIKRPARQFARRVARQKGARKGVHHFGALGRGQRKAQRSGGLDSAHQVFQRGKIRAEFRLAGLGRKRSDLGGKGFPGLAARQQNSL